MLSWVHVAHTHTEVGRADWRAGLIGGQGFVFLQLAYNPIHYNPIGPFPSNLFHYNGNKANTEWGASLMGDAS